MANYYVNGAAGDNGNTGLSEGQAWATIEYAVDNVTNTAGIIDESHTIWIKASANYTPVRAITVWVEGSVAKNKCLDIKGYKVSIGDMDFGGAYYGGALDAHKDALGATMENSSAEWVDVDASGGLHVVFDISTKDGVRFHNLYIHNTENSYPLCGIYSASTIIGGGAFNCKFDDMGSGINTMAIGFYLCDCYFGSSIVGGKAIDCPSNLGIRIENCVFDLNAFTSGVDTGLVDIKNCIFVGGPWAISVTSPSYIANNVFYNQTSGAITTNNGADDIVAAYNNIVMPAATDDYGFYVDAGALYTDYNCFWTVAGSAIASDHACWDANASVSVKGSNSIEQDPLFVDPPVGDFRLQAGSPCLNSGKPILGVGYTNIGAWQRKQDLAVGSLIR